MALHDDDIIEKVIEDREEVTLKAGKAPERMVVEMKRKVEDKRPKCRNYGW